MASSKEIFASPFLTKGISEELFPFYSVFLGGLFLPLSMESSTV